MVLSLVEHHALDGCTHLARHFAHHTIGMLLELGIVRLQRNGFAHHPQEVVLRVVVIAVMVCCRQNLDVLLPTVELGGVECHADKSRREWIEVMTLRMARFGENEHVATLIDANSKTVEQTEILFKRFSSFPSHSECGHQAQPRQKGCDGWIERKDVGTNYKVLQIIDRISKGNINSVVGSILMIAGNEVLLPFRRDIFLAYGITMPNHQRTVDEVDIPFVQDQTRLLMMM